MIALITNTRTKEARYVDLVECYPGWNPREITLDQFADRFIKHLASIYPKAYKLIHNRENSIDIMAGTVTKCIFELRAVEHLKDSDDSFLS